MEGSTETKVMLSGLGEANLRTERRVREGNVNTWKTERLRERMEGGRSTELAVEAGVDGRCLSHHS